MKVFMLKYSFWKFGKEDFLYYSLHDKLKQMFYLMLFIEFYINFAC
jgi:hypothetical protein